MLPSLTTPNPIDGRCANAKMLGGFRPTQAASQVPYFMNLPFSQLGSACFFTTKQAENLLSVLHIFTLCAVFQILQSVIRFVAVFVVDLNTVRNRMNECSHNYPVSNGPLRVLGAILQAVSVISFFDKCGLLNLTNLRTAVRGITSKSPQIRHGIDAFVANYVAPLFGFKFFFGKFDVSHSVKDSPLMVLVRLAEKLIPSWRAVSILAQ